MMPGARAIGLRARGPSPHVGILAVDGPGPPNLPQAAAPLFSLPFTLIYTMMETREIPCRNCSDTFDCFASCLFALLQQYGTLETSHSVASRLYPVTAFPGSPPFLTSQLSSAYLQLGFQCTHFLMLIFCSFIALLSLVPPSPCCVYIKLTIELFLKRVLHFDWWGKSSSVNGQTLTQEERPQQSFCAADTRRCRN